MEIVINTSYGGFSLSRKALDRLIELGHVEAINEHMERQSEEYKAFADLGKNSWLRGIARNDPLLIQVVRELGREASGAHAHLEIITVNEQAAWYLEDYDGNESIRIFSDDHGCRLL